jgi:F-type H+-transporting ATPase subunit delta
MRALELAKRYGKALFLAAREESAVDLYAAQLNEFKKAFKSESILLKFAQTPLVRSEDKEKIAKSISQTLKLSSTLTAFLALLAKRGRLALIEDICHAYQAEVDALNSVSRAKVKSASKLGEAEQKEMQKVLEQICNKKVEVEYEVEPGVIGGICAQIGSLIIDDSVRGHFNKMRDQLYRSIH